MRSHKASDVNVGQSFDQLYRKRCQTDNEELLMKMAKLDEKAKKKAKGKTEDGNQLKRSIIKSEYNMKNDKRSK